MSRILVRQGEHRELTEDEVADFIQKTEARADVGFALLYNHGGDPDCYFVDFGKGQMGAVGEKKRGPKYAPRATRADAVEMAKKFSKVFGEVTLAQVFATSSEGILMEVIEKVSADKKKSDDDDDEDCDDDEVYKAEVERVEVEKEETFSPPDGVRSNAKRGLEMRDKYNRGGTATGIARARDLSNGKSMPLSTIRRMNRFFIRHVKNKDSGPEDGKNGKIAWLLWGGDSGAAWARGIVNRKVKKTTMETVHSLNLMKDQFPSLDEAKDWVRRNGFSCDTHCELHKSWVFLQEDNDGDVREQPVATGVCVNLQKSESVQKEIPFSKVDPAKQMVEGIVYEPWVMDAHGDWMHPEDIEKAAHDFIRNGYQRNVDREHDEEIVDDVEIVESFIAPAGHPFYPEGAWVAKTHIRNAEIWTQVEKGHYNGYSMAGIGNRHTDEPPPVEKNYESFYKTHLAELPEAFRGQFQVAAIAKADFGEFGVPPGRRGSRLRKVRVKFLSLVHKGANGEDWKFKKSANCGPQVLYKSRDLRLIDGEEPVYLDNPFSKLFKNLGKFLGFSKETGTKEPGPLDVPEQERMEPVKNAGILSLMAGMAHLAQRAATSEKALLAIAKSASFSPAVQADPTIQGVLAEITKMGEKIDLQKFAMGMADFMEQQGNNGMNLPKPSDFSGHVQQFFDNPGRFMQGFPDKVESTGSFSGGSGQALSKSAQLIALAKEAGIDMDGVEIKETCDASQPSTDAEAAKRQGETTVEALMASDDEVLKRSIVKSLANEELTDEEFAKLEAIEIEKMPPALRERMKEMKEKKGKDKGKYGDDDKMEKAIAAALAKVVAPLQAEIATLRKAAPISSVAPTAGLSQDTTTGGTPPATGAQGAFVSFTDDEDLTDDIKKSIESGVVSAKNPWGAAGDALGIRVDGNLATNRQRNRG